MHLQKRLKSIQWWKLIFCIVVCNLAGNLGTLVTIDAIPTWYAFLSKPFFTPPNVIFGPVWTLLYSLMGIAVYLIWERKVTNKSRALWFFTAQLLCNVIWTFLFFWFKNPMLAFIEILLLWFLVLMTIRLFYPLSRYAAYLLYPYILWISFASLLNFAIWMLNK